MKKRSLSLVLALVMVLALLPTAAAAKINRSDLPEYEILSMLPETLQRPTRPTTLEQADLYGHPDRGGIFVEWSDESTLREITELTDSLTAGKANDTQKMKAIFDWVYQNIEYDYDATLLWARWSELTSEQRRRVNEAAEVFHVYTNRRGICEGYSNLCWLMGTIAGIPVAKLTCATSTSHARNAALLDGKWVFFDATEAWNEVDPDYSWDLDPYDRARSYSSLDFYDGVYQMYAYRGYEKNIIISAAFRSGFQCPANVTIPSYATEVSRSAFKGYTDLKSVTIPNGVTTINGDAFEGCTNLENVTIPASVTQFGPMAFRDCTSLKSVNIPDGVTEINNHIFSGCTSLESVTIPEGVTRIWSDAFAGCTSLKSVVIPDSVTDIGQCAFIGCTGLETVTLGRGFSKEAADNVLVFEGCINLKNIISPGGGTGSDAFFTIENGVLTKYTGYGGVVVIPEGVTEIGPGAFVCCENLTGVTFPSSLKKIGGSSFASCTGLASLTIPDNLIVEGGAFSECTGLKSVTIPATITRVGGFGGIFDGCTGLKSVTISDGVTELGSDFGFCTGLTSVTVPGSVKTLSGTFYNCTNLTDVTLEEGITTLSGTFQDCTSLKNIVIPNSVTEISNVTFAGCTGLKSITIPASVTEIKRFAFQGCTSLTDVYYGGTEEQWKAIQISNEENGALTSAAIHYNSPMPQQPQQPAETKTANPTNDKLAVNGAEQTPTVYKIGGSNYFKIRDIAAMLNGTEKQFAVGYAGGKVTVTSGQPYEATGKELAGVPAGNRDASPSKDTVIINGTETNVTVYKIGGSNYFKLRDLGKALNFYVGWEAGRGVYIETGKPYSK